MGAGGGLDEVSGGKRDIRNTFNNKDINKQKRIFQAEEGFQRADTAWPRVTHIWAYWPTDTASQAAKKSSISVLRSNSTGTPGGLPPTIVMAMAGGPPCANQGH